MPQEEARQNKVPLLRQMYGVRGVDGIINGKLQAQKILSDTLKTLILAVMTAILFGGWGAYKWYLKNQTLPEKFDTHCAGQTACDKELARDIGEIKQGIKDLQRRSR